MNARPTSRAARRSMLVDLAGTMPDRDLADATGLSVATIQRYRQEAAVPTFVGAGGPHARSTPPLRGSHVARWATRHDVPFLPSTYADACHLRSRDALAACEAAVMRGELVKLPIDRRCPLQHYVIA